MVDKCGKRPLLPNIFFISFKEKGREENKKMERRMQLINILIALVIAKKNWETVELKLQEQLQKN